MYSSSVLLVEVDILDVGLLGVVLKDVSDDGADSVAHPGPLGEPHAHPVVPPV